MFTPSHISCIVQAVRLRNEKEAKEKEEREKEEAELQRQIKERQEKEEADHAKMINESGDIIADMYQKKIGADLSVRVIDCTTLYFFYENITCFCRCEGRID